MNQKTLYIAIVAVVAVVVVAGVYVSGMAGSGPLAGTLAPPIVTTLTLTAEEQGCEKEVAYRHILFSGTLMGDGTPIPVRPVTIYNAEGPVAITTLNTDVNGTFSTSVGVTAMSQTDFYATFTGNSQYQSCQSNTVTVPEAVC